MRYEFKIGWCPYCNQGWAEIVKEVSNERLLVRCTECETIWNTPQDFQNDKPNAGYQFKIERVVDATDEEIAAVGWTIFLDNA